METASHAALTLTDANFDQEVHQFKGVVLVDFWATWCPPCIQMGPRVEELAEMYAGNPMVKVGKLDVDADEKTSMQYRVMSLPTFKIFAGGAVVDEVIGMSPTEALKAAIEKALTQS